jgi:hypothetical protein
MLQQGMVWRGGDGCSIQVWRDRRLPTPTSFGVQSPNLILSEQVKISNLIDQDTKGWDVVLLNEVFFEDEANVISNIPLSPLLPQD